MIAPDTKLEDLTDEEILAELRREAEVRVQESYAVILAMRGFMAEVKPTPTES
jgi:hypothetical protein